MKLIAEYTETDVECFVEANGNGDKNYLIAGVFAQSEAKNRNGRIYPKSILEREIMNYQRLDLNFAGKISLIWR